MAGCSYLAGMAKAFEFAIPTPGKAVSDCSQWIHEIKFDGFRMRVVREADRVKLFTRNGADWTSRYPWIVEAARRLKARHFVLDGEAVVLDVRAYSDFDALVSGRHDDEDASFHQTGSFRSTPAGRALPSVVFRSSRSTLIRHEKSAPSV